MPHLNLKGEWYDEEQEPQMDPDKKYYVPRNDYGTADSCERCGQSEGNDTHRYKHAFSPRRVYPILGIVHGVITTPTHTLAQGKGACGQVGTIKVSSLRQLDVHRQLSAKKNVGKTIYITHRTVQLLAVSGQVPEPFCGHCRNLLDKRQQT